MTILLYYMESYSKLLAVCEENPTKDQQCASLALSVILALKYINNLFIFVLFVDKWKAIDNSCDPYKMIAPPSIYLGNGA